MAVKHGFLGEILLTKVKSTLRMDFPSAFDFPPLFLFFPWTFRMHFVLYVIRDKQKKKLSHFVRASLHSRFARVVEQELCGKLRCTCFPKFFFQHENVGCLILLEKRTSPNSVSFAQLKMNSETPDHPPQRYRKILRLTGLNKIFFKLMMSNEVWLNWRKV